MVRNLAKSKNGGKFIIYVSNKFLRVIFYFFELLETEEKEKKTKPVNDEGFYGKITQEMLVNEIESARKTLRSYFVKNPNAQKTLIMSLEEIRNSFMQSPNSSVSKPKALERALIKEDEKLFETIKELTGINPTHITELRDLAMKLAEYMKIPFPKEIQKKRRILDWFHDNIEEIKELDLSFLYEPTIIGRF